jgi:hypothetical protein
MRKEFNSLVEVMQKYDIYQLDDEVGIALNELSNKITEVEKRIDCAVRSNKDNEELVLKLANSFHDSGKLEEFINYGEFETLQRGVHDVDISLDLNDTEAIDNDWYGLFGTRNGVTEKPMTVSEYVSTLGVQVESTEDTVELSHGGIPFRHCYHCSIKEEETVMTKVNRFWLCCDCNDAKEEESIFELDKTKFLPSTFDKVKQVIEMLKTIDNGSCVDGETMDYIVKELGFEEYLLRSLVMKSSYKETKDLLREKFEISI